MSVYDVGDSLVSKVTFLQDGVAIDPATVIFEWRWSTSPTATTWTYGVDPEVVRVDIGTYEASVPLTQAGFLLFGWRSSGPSAARQGYARVRPWRPA